MFLKNYFYVKKMIRKVLKKPIVNKLVKDILKYDPYTYRHSMNVAYESAYIGKTMSLNNKEMLNLIMAAMLHDIGKTKIDINILNKPSRLTDEEFEEIKKHPKYGYDILLKTNAFDNDVLEGVLFHHENYDGTGYYGIIEKNLPLIARIVRITDTYDAMTDNRCYKCKIKKAEAISEMGNLTTIDQDIFNFFTEESFKSKGRHKHKIKHKKKNKKK